MVDRKYKLFRSLSEKEFAMGVVTDESSVGFYSVSF